VELHHLRCFVAVAEEGSFSRAAAQLHFAPSNVTQHVQHLERELGVKVLERSPRWVGLTPAGELLLDAARQVLDDVGALRSLARQAALGRVGSLRLSYCPGSGHLLAPLVRAIAAAQPDVSLVSLQRTTAEAADDVVTGRASLGISRLRPASVHALVLCEERSGWLLAPEGHPLAARSRIVVDDLDGQPVIVVGEETQAHFHHHSVAFYREHGVEPDFRPFPVRTVEE
jgi:DNA-binding transcriptional LysR family regulator